MSKAFTKESEDDEDLDDSPKLPQGTKNYITPGGYRRLHGRIRPAMESWSARNW